MGRLKKGLYGKGGFTSLYPFLAGWLFSLFLLKLLRIGTRCATYCNGSLAGPAWAPSNWGPISFVLEHSAPEDLDRRSVMYLHPLMSCTQGWRRDPPIGCADLDLRAFFPPPKFSSFWLFFFTPSYFPCLCNACAEVFFFLRFL